MLAQQHAGALEGAHSRGASGHPGEVRTGTWTFTNVPSSAKGRAPDPSSEATVWEGGGPKRPLPENLLCPGQSGEFGMGDTKGLVKMTNYSHVLQKDVSVNDGGPMSVRS